MLAASRTAGFCCVQLPTTERPSSQPEQNNQACVHPAMHIFTSMHQGNMHDDTAVQVLSSTMGIIVAISWRVLPPY